MDARAAAPRSKSSLFKCLAPVGTWNRDFHLSIVVREDEPISRAAVGVPLFVKSPKQRIHLNLEPMHVVGRARFEIDDLTCVGRDRQ